MRNIKISADKQVKTFLSSRVGAESTKRTDQIESTISRTMRPVPSRLGNRVNPLITSKIRAESAKRTNQIEAAIAGTTRPGQKQPGNRVDRFLVSRFRVEIGQRINEGGKGQEPEIKASFTECSGLEVQTEIKEYEEGGLNSYVHKLPGRTKVSNITLKRGIISSNKLWDWFSRILDGKIEKKNVSVILCDSKNEEVMRWDFHDCFPIKWTGPNFSAKEDAITIETLELAPTDMRVQINEDYGKKSRGTNVSATAT
jgi:phage tail-like protein